VNINYAEMHCTFSSVDKRYFRKIIQMSMTGCIQYDCEFLAVYPQYEFIIYAPKETSYVNDWYPLPYYVNLDDHKHAHFNN
jgi:hypothetical protein